MQPEEIKSILEQNLELSEVHVTGDGSHFQVIAVGNMFDGMSRVKKQQAIYAPLNAHIADGTLHALSIRTFTDEEWQRDKKLIMPDS